MKKIISGALAVSAAVSLCASASAAEQSEKNVIVMTVPKSYAEVYEKISSVVENPRLYYRNGVVPLAMEEEAVDSVEMEAPAAENTKMAMADSAAAEAAPQTGADDYSGTNTQVDGIDEGDIVKTDGKNIYILRDNQEVIILAADGKDTKKISEIPVTAKRETINSKEGYDYYYYSSYQYASDIYVNENILAVIKSDNGWYDFSRNNMYTYFSANCVNVDLYDISNPEKPVIKASLGQDGNYSDSRLVDGKLYMISNYSVYGNLDKDNPDTFIPHVYKNGKKSLAPLSTIVYPPEVETANYINIVCYDLNKCDITESKSLLGREGNTIYMSDANLYIANSKYCEDVVKEYKKSVYDVKDYENGYRTEIIKMSYKDKITTKAIGTVPGNLLNQFALDEYDGNLRVVTTEEINRYSTYTDPEMNFTNYVYGEGTGTTNALRILDKNLNPLGAITGLAQDERVYSVRFTGDIGYFVTFRQVDPLFAVDLSNPAEPKIMSQLKIPGFSNYLHPYTNDLLFGLGMNADEQTGRTSGMKLSMFNTSNPYDVYESAKLSLENDSYSEALYNHKAILVAPARGIIGFPCSDGYAVFGYSNDRGFYEISRIEMECKWSGDSRGLYIGSYFYVVLQDMTVVLDMSDYTTAATVKY